MLYFGLAYFLFKDNLYKNWKCVREHGARLRGEVYLVVKKDG